MAGGARVLLHGSFPSPAAGSHAQVNKRLPPTGRSLPSIPAFFPLKSPGCYFVPDVEAAMLRRIINAASRRNKETTACTLSPSLWQP